MNLCEHGEELHPVLDAIMLEPFDIRSPEGTMVVALFNKAGKIQHGTTFDKEQAQKHFVTGKVYTVDHTDIHSYHTNVYLKDFPDVNFNSVHFATVITQL